ncbi:phage tail tube protein [Algiphilus sp.]|uniref:phage tail tube protein n=1 Tax=Algiphilus sp. TaxID=1872431 RepID=UPI0025BA6413|nr:phage tail tube protein [Algiphilus sp.]MCK5769469.1 hypothetical protein [Algiphilus sp.]
MSLYAKRLILAAIGSNPYPTDPEPTASDNAVLARNIQFQPFQGATATLDYDRPTLGAGKQYYTGPHGRLTFEVDLSGSGEAGTAPAWGPLLQMCGFAETVTAETDVVYSLLSTGFEWGSIYFNHDGELHKLLGCRGTVSFTLNKGGMPSMAFEFWGLWDQTPTSAAVGTPDFSAFIDPVPVNEANTPTFTLDSYAAKCEAFSIDAGWDVQYRNVINDEHVRIVDRETTGQATIEKPALSDKDFYALVRGHSVVAGQLVHGTTAGNIITFDVKAQLLMGADSNSQGLSVFPLDLRCIPTDAGDDELTITLT